MNSSPAITVVDTLLALLILTFAGAAGAQQLTDEDFSLEIPSPTYRPGDGPTLCIDEAHNNFHTIDGNYKAFANLVRSDGYRALGFAKNFSIEALSECDILVISNAIGAGNQSSWSYPHNSAFSRREISALVTWIDAGGNLLLIADHAPMAGAASGLGAAIGIVMLDAYADGNPAGDDIFSRVDGSLHEHSILQGRDPDAAIHSIMTFTGQAAHITADWTPLISFGPRAMAFINPQQTVQLPERTSRPTFSIAGLIHGATRELGTGRIVFLGEAAMCTAQLAGPNQLKMGMNNPNANENAQFCLNVIHWLDRILD